MRSLIVPAAILFLAAPQLKAEILDGDGDGVPNDRDLCPNSVSVLVGSQGCAQEKPDRAGAQSEAAEMPRAAAANRAQADTAPPGRGTGPDHGEMNADNDHEPLFEPPTAGPSAPTEAPLEPPRDGYYPASLTIYFPAGGSRFLLDAPPELHGLARRLRDQPDQAVTIYGYAQATGNSMRDLSLARSRAKEIGRLLMIDGAPFERVRYADPSHYPAIVSASDEDAALRANRAIARVHPEFD